MKKLLLALGLLGLSGNMLSMDKWKETINKIDFHIDEKKVSDFSTNDETYKTHLYQLVQAFKPLINDNQLKEELGGGFSWWRRWTGIGTTPQTDYQKLEKYLFPFIKNAPLYVTPDKEVINIIQKGLDEIKQAQDEKNPIKKQIENLHEKFKAYKLFLENNKLSLKPGPRFWDVEQSSLRKSIFEATTPIVALGIGGAKYHTSSMDKPRKTQIDSLNKLMESIPEEANNKFLPKIKEIEKQQKALNKRYYSIKQKIGELNNRADSLSTKPTGKGFYGFKRPYASTSDRKLAELHYEQAKKLKPRMAALAERYESLETRKKRLIVQRERALIQKKHLHDEDFYKLKSLEREQQSFHQKHKYATYALIGVGATYAAYLAAQWWFARKRFVPNNHQLEQAGYEITQPTGWF